MDVSARPVCLLVPWIGSCLYLALFILLLSNKMVAKNKLLRVLVWVQENENLLVVRDVLCAVKTPSSLKGNKGPNRICGRSWDWLGENLRKARQGLDGRDKADLIDFQVLCSYATWSFYPRPWVLWLLRCGFPTPALYGVRDQFKWHCSYHCSISPAFLLATWFRTFIYQ